eukprot:9493001-Pyramimonas_sp.AAC.1
MLQAVGPASTKLVTTVLQLLCASKPANCVDQHDNFKRSVSIVWASCRLGRPKTAKHCLLHVLGASDLRGGRW